MQNLRGGEGEEREGQSETYGMGGVGKTDKQNFSLNQKK